MKKPSRHVYRVGLGQTASGKILDRDTHSYIWAIHALEDALQSRKPVFVSRNKKAYVELIIEDLYKLAEEEEKEKEEYEEINRIHQEVAEEK